MHVSITCKACGTAFKVHSRFAGKLGACPKPECGRKFLVPSPNAAPEAAPDRGDSPSEEDVDWLYRHAGVERPTEPPAREKTRSSRPASDTKRAARKPAPEANRTKSAPTFLQRPALRWSALGLAVTVVGLGSWLAVGRGGSPSPAVSSEAATMEPEPKELQEAREREAALLTAFHGKVQPYLKTYCVECHTGDQSEAGIVLDGFSTDSDDAPARKDRKTWERVVRMLEAGAMPPGDHPVRPKPEDTTAVVAWMDERVFRVDCALPNDPGRVTVRRLNRNEYNNTVRDLLGVTIRPADDFPSDDVGYGFDNIGDVLSLPPLLMEKYLDAAEKVARAVIVVADPKGSVQRVEGDSLDKSGQFGVNEENAVGIFSSGNVSKEFKFPIAGEYTLRVEAMADQAGPDLAKVELRLDGRPVKSFDVAGQHKLGTYETTIKVDAGNRTVAGAFTNDYYAPKAKNPKDRDRNLYVKSLEVQGPIGISAADFPETHRRLVTARPDERRSLHDAARQVLRPLVKRAFRRPVADDEVEPFVKLVEFAVKQGDPYERGLQVALQGVLVSPHFLFRIERDPDPDNPKAKRTVTGAELASRLSYFLWSSMPDEELARAGENGELLKPDGLRRQTTRMLADPKSRAFVENFGGQWLNLRNLDELTPDPKLFPDFNPALKADMRKETELFFQHIVRNDRSLLDFIDGKYTFLNDRLAKHYGLPSPGSDEFKEVKLEDARRAGVLTQASILTLTSDPTKTSPVKRGKWILENILGSAPPPPPPNVPELAETQKANPNLTLRQQLEIHRKNPACATCHQQMDPLGMGFENFDAIGRWREKDNDQPIDSSGTLPTGETFSGPAELRAVLKTREKKFARHFAAQLLTYALGRGLEPSDRCTVDEIADAAAKDGYRFSVLVQSVVASRPFLNRRGEGEGEGN